MNSVVWFGVRALVNHPPAGSAAGRRVSFMDVIVTYIHISDVNQCPLCGNRPLEHKHGEYRFEPPQNIPGGTMIIADATWDACAVVVKKYCRTN